MTARKDTDGEGRLWLQCVDDAFDMRKDEVIDVWCCLGPRSPFEDLDPAAFVSPHPDVEAQRRDSTVIRRYANALAEEMVPLFNERLGTDYGYAYWRVLLLPWLLLILQPILIRTRRVAAFVERHRGRSFRVGLHDGERDWPLRDIADFETRVLRSEAFNHWLTARLLRDLAPGHWRLEDLAELPGSHEPMPERPECDLGSGPVRRLRRLLYDGRCRRVRGVRWTSPLLSAFLSVLPRKAPHTPHREPASVAELESMLPSVFVRHGRDILMRMVPRTLGADFHHYDRPAAARRYRPGKVRLIGPLLHYNEEDRFLLAHAVEKGELIVCTQHGGSGYQGLNTNSVETENRQAAYLTWGWTRQRGTEGRLIPVPSPAFSPFADSHRGRSGHLCFATNVGRVHGGRLETAPMPEACLIQREDRCDFLAGLPERLRSSLRYRPHPASAGEPLEDVEHLTARFPWLTLDEKDFEASLLDCRLLVTEYPGTTFSLALAANVPLVAYFNPRCYTVAPEAEAAFAALADAGVFHQAPEAAAEQVARVWDDLPGWWRSPEVQTARRLFVDSYALIGRWWLVSWMRALAAL